MNNHFVVSLVGNPNCGKTAVFNALTDSYQRVGNWPGVTIDVKHGFFQHQNLLVQVVDLPGIYSTNITSDAIDEKITCQYLLSNRFDIIVNVIDGSNLERNLYLTLQLLEMNVPVILAVNMMDVVKKRGLKLDLKQFSVLLDSPVINLVARKHQGINFLKKTILRLKKNPYLSKFRLPLPDAIHKSVDLITRNISFDNNNQTFLIETIALRLLEGDCLVKKLFRASSSVLRLIKHEIDRIKTTFHEEPDILIADTRYIVINQIIKEVIQFTKTPQKSITQRIDRIVLNRFLSVPIFFGIVYLMFVFSINIGGAFQEFFDIGSKTIFVDGLVHILTLLKCPIWAIKFLAIGVGKGINTTVTFTPIVGGMFLFLTFLEDCGYMARIVFVMDRFMRMLGLPGKSFILMIIGFGCNVPAVIGSRILENRYDRILTVIMTPFMSCGARMAIFSVFASAFFPKNGAFIIFVLYLTGVLIAIFSGLILRSTLLPGKPASLVMELPMYHIPQLSSLSYHTWQRLKNFLFRAGQCIIPVCVIISILNSFTITGTLVKNVTQEETLLSTIGRVITPVFSPLGIKKDNWPATVGLTTGILAKEVVIGTLNALYSKQNHLDTQQILLSDFNFLKELHNAILSIPKNLVQLNNIFTNPMLIQSSHKMNKIVYNTMYKQFGGNTAAFTYLLFILLYFPCVSTVAVMYREVGKNWALFSIMWSTSIAYILSVMCYQLLTIFQHPWATLSWVSGLITVLIIIIIGLRYCDFIDRK
ncbi:Fe(2+) transporter permease subunit FeoB [Coxiella endosymbiont of Amblyomma americanum]|uniref:Fe(2+) transporter permease subunit FeoB n=1 Tax=Coxiella endosymbiont of Amblyomma americanum TaxID=325775 RepID=UPI00057C6699|nr:Fe(2+) transporter permease subunit FeoB [Coxiella endosymbiont of Amblyomma americanum]AJC50177.1 iron transporter FeoB [Coxiella endosymbiont of Amblyomma americanum]AUJ58537.1 ferrous iron transporter B [Coxiella-like endosymbiont of Amblyomma americanum]